LRGCRWCNTHSLHRDPLGYAEVVQGLRFSQHWRMGIVAENLLLGLGRADEKVKRSKDGPLGEPAHRNLHPRVHPPERGEEDAVVLSGQTDGIIAKDQAYLTELAAAVRERLARQPARKAERIAN